MAWISGAGVGTLNVLAYCGGPERPWYDNQHNLSLCSAHIKLLGKGDLVLALASFAWNPAPGRHDIEILDQTEMVDRVSKILPSR
jgi:hypothetical protein